MEHKIFILIIDGRKAQALAMSEVFENQGHGVTLAATPELALSQLEQGFFDLVFLSDSLPGDAYFDLLLHISGNFRETSLICLAGRATVAGAVEAVRLGALDYLPDPSLPEELLSSLNDALEYRAMRRENRQKQQQKENYNIDSIVGQSGPMQEVFRLIHKVAATDATVLILGESGTGKELVARAIHHNSNRSEKPLIPVNCGAIPEDLLESELFGHEKGAFTGAIKSKPGRFELAGGGTIFLDEIGDMSPSLQVKLLRALQEHQFERVGGTRTIAVDIRVIAATHRDLRKKVEDGTFREDLYYRLNVIPVNVPPLRERRGDIALLCRHFLERLTRVKGLEEKQMSPEVLEGLMRYNWPGNVRELENLLERMVILANGPVLQVEDLPPKLRELKSGGQGAPTPWELPASGIDFNSAVDEFERNLIVKALEKAGWVKNQAALLLGLNRTTLVEKIKKKGLIEPDGKNGGSA
ncbi:MAG: sigma-54 dependent transcriptional regulator [Desulfarculales bacterium]|nr:sigma-54 dependent transcriptional regulator [Desulfarculales bacterium]